MHEFFQFLFGVAIGLVDRSGCLAQVVKLAELVRYIFERRRDRISDRTLAVGDHGLDGNFELIADDFDQFRQILLTTREQASSQQNLAGKTVSQDPQNLVAYVGLHAVDRENDATLFLENAIESTIIGQRNSQQFVVAIEQIRNASLGNRDFAFNELAMNFRQTAMFDVS